jgi:hypothetical protein
MEDGLNKVDDPSLRFLELLYELIDTNNVFMLKYLHGIIFALFKKRVFRKRGMEIGFNTKI